MRFKLGDSIEGLSGIFSMTRNQILTISEVAENNVMGMAQIRELVEFP